MYITLGVVLQQSYWQATDLHKMIFNNFSQPAREWRPRIIYKKIPESNTGRDLQKETSYKRQHAAHTQVVYMSHTFNYV